VRKPPVFRDPTAWMHIALIIDTTQATAADRAKLYINGVLETFFDTATYPVLNSTIIGFNAANIHKVGEDWNGGNYYDGYIAEFIWVDGSASIDDFGEFDNNGNWVPIDPSTGFQQYAYLTGEAATFGNNITGGAGIAGAFDGAASSSWTVGFTNWYAGQEWGSGVTKRPIRCILEASNVSDFASGSIGDLDVTVYGSNSLPSNGTDGTSLATYTITDAAARASSERIVIDDLTATTDYRYHWVFVDDPAATGGESLYIGEIEFYDDGGLGFGTNGFYLDFADKFNLGRDDKNGPVESTETTYRYFKLDVTATTTANCSLEQIQIIDKDGVDHPFQTLKSSDLTSGSWPGVYPYVFNPPGDRTLVVNTSSDVNDAAWHAFDDTPGAGTWSAAGATAWITIDLGAGNGISFKELTLTAMTIGGRAPKDFTLQGSNTGAFSGEEDILLSRAGETFANSEARTFRYSSAIATTTSGDWDDPDGDFTIAPGIIQSDVATSALKSNFTFEGDFEISFFNNYNGGCWGLYEVFEDGTFDKDHNYGGMNAMSASYYGYIDVGNYYYGSAVQQAIGGSATTSKTVKFTRVSGLISVYINNVLQFTWPQASTNELRFIFAAGTINEDWAGVQYSDGAVIEPANDFTPDNLTPENQVLDSPTDDASVKEDIYCVMRAEGGGGVVSEGGLVVDCDDESCRGTVYKSGGLFYFEQILDVGSTNATVIGISEDTGTIKGSGGNHTLHEAQANAYAWYNETVTPVKTDQSGTTTPYGTGLIDQDTVMQCAVNLTLGYIWFGTDDIWFDPAGVASSATVKASMEAGESTYAAFTGVSGNFTPYHMNVNGLAVRFNFGSTAFYYTPPIGFSAWVERDVSRPVGNYATLNPLVKHTGGVLSEGNLRWTSSGVAAWRCVSTTIVPTEGKVYWELFINTAGYLGLGLVELNEWSGKIITTSAGTSVGFITVAENSGAITRDGVAAIPYCPTFTTNDVISFALDVDNKALWMAINGVWVDGDGSDNSATVLSEILTGNFSSAADSGWRDGRWAPVISAITAGSVTARFNPKDWSYLPPNGYMAICTANLPKPAIKDPSAQFQTTLYSGNAAADTDIIQTESKTFTPDIVLIKNRDTTDQWKFIDVVRGATKEINIDGTDAESTDVNGLSAFNSNGFTLGTGANGYNDSGEAFVAYQFNAGNSEVVNSDGTVNVTQRASVISGVSIGTFTSPASGTFTLGHGLTNAPGFVAIKQLDATGGWWAHLSGLNANQYLRLEGTDAVATSTSVFNNSLPTSSIVSSTSGGTWLAASTPHLLWCMESIDGFSKQFSYTGNGSADGPFVNLGFKPELLVLKRTAGADPWWVLSDKTAPYNLVDPYLQLDGALAESTSSTQSDLDFVSSGFKLRTSAGGTNSSGALYVGFAFAKNPFGGKGVSQARAR
jgi:hypothetical protein